MKNSILLIFLSLLFVSCNYKDKENALDLREKQLLDKEKSFAQKEADYRSLLKMRDSIFSKKDADSIKIVRWPQEIAGSWIVKVFCTESNCSYYVVVYMRTDTW
ncbi:MAG: hypothetical protein RSD71_18405 [Flavobacterium sp.]